MSKPADDSKEYTKLTFERLELFKECSALEPYTKKDDGLWLEDVKKWEINTCQWHPGDYTGKAALPFPFSAFDFAAFILHGGGSHFMLMNFDNDDCETLREDVGLAPNSGLAVQLLRAAYALRTEALDRFDLRKKEAVDEDFTKAAAWLLEKNNLPHSTENIALEVVMAVEETAPTVPAPPPAQSLETPAIAAAFDGILGVDEEKWKKRLGDVAHYKWLLPARVSKSQAPKSATWCPIKLGELFLKKGADEAALKKAFSKHQNLKAWRDEWANLTRERNAFGS